MTLMASILWARLDLPGHDACRLERHGEEWRLEGMAVFRHRDGPAALAYTVDCGADWFTRRGTVHGFVGDRRIVFMIERVGEVWKVNDVTVPEIGNLVDLDLGFTPATNLIPLRRTSLRQGEAHELPAAWLDIDAGALATLPQIYRRRDEDTFWYRAPTAGYEGLLRVTPEGFVRSYPGLWKEVPPT